MSASRAVILLERPILTCTAHTQREHAGFGGWLHFKEIAIGDLRDTRNAIQATYFKCTKRLKTCKRCRVIAKVEKDDEQTYS